MREWGNDGGPGGHFHAPTGLARDGSGHLFVVDTRNNRIQKCTPGGECLLLWGTRGSGPGQFYEPAGIAVDQRGHVFVADSYNERLQEFAPEGSFRPLDISSSPVGPRPPLYPRLPIK